MSERSQDFMPIDPINRTRIDDDKAHQGYFIPSGGEVIEVFPDLVDRLGRTAVPESTNGSDSEQNTETTS